MYIAPHESGLDKMTMDYLHLLYRACMSNQRRVRYEREKRQGREGYPFLHTFVLLGLAGRGGLELLPQSSGFLSERLAEGAVQLGSQLPGATLQITAPVEQHVGRRCLGGGGGGGGAQLNDE